METIEIDKVLKLLQETKEKIDNVPPPKKFIVVAPVINDGIDYKKYKGKGRPRKTDYKWIKNPIIDHISSL